LHKNFDHESLFQLLDSRDKWILSYNDCSYIRNLYKNYKIIELDHLCGSKSSEVLIFSKS
jgi:DNA adenine methylase